jgi:uncharacterized protein YkwD
LNSRNSRHGLALSLSLLLSVPACVEQASSTSASDPGSTSSLSTSKTVAPSPTASPSPRATPSPAPAPSPVPTGSLTGTATLDTEERAFLTLINQYRAQSGLTALQPSVKLIQASDWLSSDMATRNYFSHTDLQGRDPFTRMHDFGYTTYTSAAENIAAGNATAQATFTQWKNSAGHNANMLGASYRAIGIGRAQDTSSSYGWYWTTDFGSFVDQVAQ